MIRFDFIVSVNALCEELEDRIKKGIGVFPKGTTRLLNFRMSMAVPNWKVPFLVETSGAVIVGEESCVGERGTQWLTEGKGDTVAELLDDITERYFKIDWCGVYTQPIEN